MGTPGYKGHILICGWNATAKAIIDEFKEAKNRRPVVVLADMERRPVRNTSVYFVRGDPASSEDLQRAGIMDASAAIIFPQGNESNADSQSLLIALAIEVINPKVYTCVEVLDPRNKEHFRHAHVDEIVVAAELGAHLLARATLYPGMTGVVGDLLSSDNGNEFYKIPLDGVYAGQSFDLVLLDLRRRLKVILLGVERSGETILNPREELVIQPGDQGLVVAWEEPKLGQQEGAKRS